MSYSELNRLATVLRTGINKKEPSPLDYYPDNINTFISFSSSIFFSSSCIRIPFLMQGDFIFSPSHFPHFWNVFLKYC